MSRHSPFSFTVACLLTVLAWAASPSQTHAGESTAARTIYRCHVNGVLTFSDYACGGGAQEYQSDDSRVTPYEAPAVPKPSAPRDAGARTNKSKGATTANRSSQRTDPARQAVECERLENSLREIRSKERSGYTAKEGERLRARRDKIEQKRQARGC